ncbi:hypothetical protein CH063_13436, partial [Colletotrichum higginsianum]
KPATHERDTSGRQRGKDYCDEGPEVYTCRRTWRSVLGGAGEYLPYLPRYLNLTGCNHCSLKKAFVKAKSIVPMSKHLANLRPNSNDAVRCVVVASLSR